MSIRSMLVAAAFVSLEAAHADRLRPSERARWIGMPLMRSLRSFQADRN
jgi:hypothetical protein